MNASIPDESATGYASSLHKRVTPAHVIRMIKKDKIRGYQRGDEWFLDEHHAIQDAPNAPRLIRLGLFLLTANALLLITFWVLGEAWSEFETATVVRRSMFYLGGAIGLVSIVAAVLTHLNVLQHRKSERARLAGQGLEPGHLGRERSIVALLLGAIGLIFVLFYAGLIGTAGLIVLIVVSFLVFLIL